MVYPLGAKGKSPRSLGGSDQYLERHNGLEPSVFCLGICPKCSLAC